MDQPVVQQHPFLEAPPGERVCVCVCECASREFRNVGYEARPTARKRAEDLEVAVDAVSYRIPIEWRRDFAATETLHGLAEVDVFR